MPAANFEDHGVNEVEGERCDDSAECCEFEEAPHAHGPLFRATGRMEAADAVAMLKADERFGPEIAGERICGPVAEARPVCDARGHLGFQGPTTSGQNGTHA
jgi:hypothetical protein